MWQSKLLQWYQRHRRDLPWRRTKDPYAIWVSEIMLQQTTVETVIPYYEKFLKRFPNVQKLAEADEEEVLRLWSGLGYYSRARNLHKAAKILLSQIPPTPLFQRGARGDFTLPLPETVDDLMKLPGIGRYTAGAIASIAFNQPAPILDGNVIRVLSRFFKITKDPKTTRGQKYFWGVSRGAINCALTCYGDFNQALMELGAILCTPENPKCPRCPLRSDCQARKEGRPEHYPRIQKKTRYVAVELSAAVIQRADGRVLLVQRPNHGVLKKLWEFPTVEGDQATLQRSLAVTCLKALPTVRHSIMNRRLLVRPWLCRLPSNSARVLAGTDLFRPAKRSKRSNKWQSDGGFRGRRRPKKYPEGISPPEMLRWILPHELQALPTSSMNHKILKHLPPLSPPL